MGHFSAWAGGVALAMLVIPVVVRTTENMLPLVPNHAARGGLGARRAALEGHRSGRHLARRARRHRHRRPARHRADHRRDGAAALHRAQQPVLVSLDPNAADGEPAGDHLPVRPEPYRRLAAARLDRRADHHLRACSRSTSSRASSRAWDSRNERASTASRRRRPRQPPPDADGVPVKIAIEDLRFFYGDIAGAEGHQHRRSASARSPRSSARPAAASPRCCASSTACTTSIRTSAPRARSSSTATTSFARDQDLNLLRASIGMVFQKPTPFPMTIYDNIAFGIQLYENVSPGRAGRAGRGGADQGGALGRGQGQARRQRPQPLRRPAAAPVHRPHHRRPAGGRAPRRAVLGARSDLDLEDRGADRRAEERLHDRHRHPQHAAGGARLRLHRLHVSRRAGRVRRDRSKIFTAPSDRRTQDYITGRFG